MKFIRNFEQNLSYLNLDDWSKKFSITNLFRARMQAEYIWNENLSILCGLRFDENLISKFHTKSKPHI